MSSKTKDWVGEALPSARKGYKAVDAAFQNLPFLPRYYTALWQRIRKGEAPLHYGSLRFSQQGQLTDQNQPKQFRAILRNPDLIKDKTVQDTVEELVSRKKINGHKFEIKCSEKDDAETSIEFPTERSYNFFKFLDFNFKRDVTNTITLRLGKKNPQETKAALLIAREIAQSNLRPSDLNPGYAVDVGKTPNLENWIQNEGSKTLKDALSSSQIQIEFDTPNNRYNISKIRQREVGQETPSAVPPDDLHNSGRFVPGAVPAPRPPSPNSLKR